MAADLGIKEKDRLKILEALSRLLADSYTLYLKTHNFHWNVTGPMFQTLHLMFMGQYTELWNAVDPIAERIRSLGHHAPGSYAQFARLSSLPDAPEVCLTIWLAALLPEVAFSRVANPWMRSGLEEMLS